MSDDGRRALLGSMAGLGLLAALPAKAQDASSMSVAEKAETSNGATNPRGSPPTPQVRIRVTSSSLPSFARDKSQQTLFASLKSQYLANFSSLISPLQNNSTIDFRHITSDLQYKAQALDDAFNPFQVETLLDQASNILDRAIRDRSQYEAIAAEYFSLMTELGEYLALDEIHKEEEAAGIYDVDWKTSLSELNAEYEIRDLNYLCHYESDWTLQTQFSNEAKNNFSGATQCAAWISGLVPYSFKDQTFAGYQQHTWNGISKNAFLHLRDSAFVTSWHYLHNQEWSVSCAKLAYEGQWKSSAARSNGLENKENWENAKRIFQRRRTLVARNVQDVRLQAAVSSDGVLNSSRRLPAVKKRFEQDFNNALGRLRAASQGLISLFGYTDPLPHDTNDLDFFDNCLSWTRKSTDWLIRFARLEQSYIHVVSLKDFLGRSMYNAGRSNLKWEIRIGHNEFPSMSHIRLRGVSVFVDDAIVKRTWKFKVSPPKSSELTTLDGQIRKLDQSEIRPVVVGRAAEYGSPREPDINGTSSLINVSPIGLWTVELWGESPSTENISGLDDVVLHMITVYAAR